MPFTVPVSFDRFIDNISLSGDHRDTADARKERIVSLLKNAFTILEAFATGSIPRRTALKSDADLDVMVALHFGKHCDGKTPEQVLQAVRDALGEYRTNVRKNGQAVTLHYDSWPNVDIAPVFRTTNTDGSVAHYNVPDMNSGKWISSRPTRHSAAINAKAGKCGTSFRHIIRIIKHWNTQHSDLMTSYHVEVLALKIYGDAPLDDLPWDVFQFFDKTVELAGSLLWYEDGWADDYLDYTTRQEVVTRLSTARDLARNAWSSAYGDKPDHERAIRLWGQMFGDQFPAYG
jgi:hypothetical protein